MLRAIVLCLLLAACSAPPTSEKAQPPATEQAQPPTTEEDPGAPAAVNNGEQLSARGDQADDATTTAPPPPPLKARLTEVRSEFSKDSNSTKTTVEIDGTSVRYRQTPKGAHSNRRASPDVTARLTAADQARLAAALEEHSFFDARDHVVPTKPASGRYSSLELALDISLGDKQRAVTVSGTSSADGKTTGLAAHPNTKRASAVFSAFEAVARDRARKKDPKQFARPR